MTSLDDFVELTGSLAELAGAAEIWSRLGEADMVTEMKEASLKAIKTAISVVSAQPPPEKEKEKPRGSRRPVSNKQSA